MMEIERRTFQWPDQNGGLRLIYWECGHDTLPVDDSPVDYLQLENGDKFEFTSGLKFKTLEGKSLEVNPSKIIKYTSPNESPVNYLRLGNGNKFAFENGLNLKTKDGQLMSVEMY